MWKYVEFNEMEGGPEGFKYAVRENNQVIAWFESKDKAELMAWSLCYLQMLKETKNKDFLNLILDFFSKVDENITFTRQFGPS